MKTISLISRLESLSLSQFRDYYEHTHCLKAMKYFPFQKYRRNYIVSGGEGLDFDCLSEVEIDPDPSLQDVVNSDAWAMMKEDERQFMRPECIRFAKVSEQMLVQDGDVSSETSDDEHRFALFLQRGEMDREAFDSSVREIGNNLEKDLRGVRKSSALIVEDLRKNPLPFDAVVWVSAQVDQKQLSGTYESIPGLLSITEVHSCSSDPDVLRYRFSGNTS